MNDHGTVTPEVMPSTVPALSFTDDRERPVAERFLIRGLDWARYRKISEALDGRHFRLAFDGENLELMTISSTHANGGRLIGRFVGVLTEELGLPIKSCGDMTCEREEVERAIEPDECFYLVNEPLIRHKPRIDLETDPPPDLAVEVDITRSSLNRLAIHAALGIAEIWRFNGEIVEIYLRCQDGQYVRAEHSQHFKFVSSADLLRFLQFRTQMDETSLVRLFRAWVREQIAKER